MKFLVFSLAWAGGMKITPEQILAKYCKDSPKLIEGDGEFTGDEFEVDITGDELIAMASCGEFDIMISSGSPRLLFFDAYGRKFRQR